MAQSKLNLSAYERIGAPEYVFDWIRNGVQLKFSQKPARCYYKNRINSLKEFQFIDHQVQQLELDGTIRCAFEKPRCILALQCMPKKNKKLRLVVDCRPVNEHMVTPKFSQEGINTVGELIEKDDEMITIDLKDGFYHLGVHIDSQTYLGFKWRGKFFVWQYLPFGVAMCPLLF